MKGCGILRMAIWCSRKNTTLKEGSVVEMLVDTVHLIMKMSNDDLDFVSNCRYLRSIFQKR